MFLIAWKPLLNYATAKFHPVLLKSITRKMPSLHDIHPRAFLRCAKAILSRGHGMRSESNLRSFYSFFGVSPLVCAIIWRKLGPAMKERAKPWHFLWCLMFLNVYANEHAHGALAKTTEPTFRSWSWRFVKLIAEMDIVCETIVTQYIFTNLIVDQLE